MTNKELMNFFSSRPSPVSESEALRAFFGLDAVHTLSEEELYRKHFLLYHTIYVLQDSPEVRKDHFIYIRLNQIYVLKFPPKDYCNYFDETSIAFCSAKIDNSQTGGPRTNFQSKAQSGCVSGADSASYSDWLLKKELPNSTQNLDHFCQYHRSLETEIKENKELARNGIKNFYLNMKNINLFDAADFQNFKEKFIEYIAHWEKLDGALRVMGLEFGFTTQRLKQRYHYLCKKFHPDLANTCRGSDWLNSPRRTDYHALTDASDVYETLEGSHLSGSAEIGNPGHVSDVKFKSIQDAFRVLSKIALDS